MIVLASSFSFVIPHSFLLVFYRPSDTMNQSDLTIIPKVPSGVSGTALAASLLRDGWSVCRISFILLIPYNCFCLFSY